MGFVIRVSSVQQNIHGTGADDGYGDDRNFKDCELIHWAKPNTFEYESKR